MTDAKIKENLVPAALETNTCKLAKCKKTLEFCKLLKHLTCHFLQTFIMGDRNERHNTNKTRKASNRFSTYMAMKKKRKRTVISKSDLEHLEQVFMEEKWPSRSRKESMARKLGKPEEFISTWFQNRRAKDRRLQKESNSTTSVDEGEQRPLMFHNVSEKVYGKEKTKKRIYMYLQYLFSCIEKRSSIDLITRTDNKVKELSREANSYMSYETKTAPILEDLPNKTEQQSDWSWNQTFARIIRMMAASEGVLPKTHQSFTSATKDAAIGVRIHKGNLIYNKDYGLEVTNLCVTRANKSAANRM